MRLLVITHMFPPSRYANAKRPYYLVKGFLNGGWQVQVITSFIGVETGAAETVAHPALHIIRLKDPVDQLYRRLAGHPALHRVIRMALRGILWPDDCVLWSLRALRTCGNAAGYDRVLAFVQPASLLLSGLGARRVSERWVFDFQESITPYFRQFPSRSPLHRVMLPVYRKLEGHTLHKAGRVVFTADTNRRSYIRDGLVKEATTAHIPYFFDIAMFSEPTEATSRRFEIVYFGAFNPYGGRSPEIFMRTLAKFLDQRPEARPHTSFSYYGSWITQHNRFIEELKLRDVVSINQTVGYEEYIRRLKQSPILLLVLSSEHNLFMPSKIVDYLGAQRPILAFVPRDSEMCQVLEAAGMGEYVCDEHDVEGGTAALERLWIRYQAGTLSANLNKASFWSSNIQIPRYLDSVAITDGAA